jgi:Uma2 family endonuclease
MPSTRQTAGLPETMGELLAQLGDISPSRVRLKPAPGKATERDVLDILNRTDRLYELVDGVLVEKVMGYTESSLACDLIKLLGIFLDQHNLGNLAGPDGTMRLMPKLVRIPDISFVRWEKLPNRQRPTKPIPDLVPDLAVEVLSEGNTPGEMARKLKDYFITGVQLVWFVDPESRTIQVFTAPDRSVTLTEADTLNGGDVLPGLSLPVKQVFALQPPPQSGQEAGTRRRPRSRKKPRKRKPS